MKKPFNHRWFDGKELSYLISWVCITLASAMLFPIVISSKDSPLSSRIIIGVILVVMFVLGVYSLVIEAIDYHLYKKNQNSIDDEEEQLK